MKKLTWGLLTLILIIASFMRLYRISDYMTFLGDEGRDVMVARDILLGNFTLLGPRASAGDFFLGPIYYYFMAPWLWLFQGDPVGPAVMVALVGVATVWLIYFVGKRWFNTAAGLFAAALYAVSPIVITYSHSSWNPNIMPFFALLIMYVIYKAVGSARAWKYFLLTGFLLGIAIQLHYLAVFLGFIVALYMFFGQWLMEGKIRIRAILRSYVFTFFGFIAGLSPFLLFELRHGFPNTKTIFGFIFGSNASSSYESGGNFFTIIADVFFRVFAKLVFYFPATDRYDQFPLIQLQLFGLVILIMATAGIVSVYFAKNKFVTLLIYLWLFVGVLLFGVYKKPIYDYYFTFLFPVPFLIIGSLLSKTLIWGKDKKQKIIAAILTGCVFPMIFAYSLTGMPFLNEPNKQKDQARIIAEEVLKHAGNREFNFALITAANSDHVYRYYFILNGHPPVTIQNDMIDPERKTVKDQLFVVCEQAECKPLGHPLYEIAGFGPAKIVDSWDVLVFKVYKLEHDK